MKVRELKIGQILGYRDYGAWQGELVSITQSGIVERSFGRCKTITPITRPERIDKDQIVYLYDLPNFFVLQNPEEDAQTSQLELFTAERGTPCPKKSKRSGQRTRS